MQVPQIFIKNNDLDCTNLLTLPSNSFQGLLVGLDAAKINPGALDLNRIQALHRHLVAGNPTYKDTPGDFRKVQNWIGGPRILAKYASV